MAWLAVHLPEIRTKKPNRGAARPARDHSSEKKSSSRRLNSTIWRQRCDGSLHDLELSGLHRQRVEKDGHDDDPSDRKQPVPCPINGRCNGCVHRHMEHKNGSQHGRDQASRRCHMRGDSSRTQQSQQHDDRKCRDQCRKKLGIQWVVVLQPGHKWLAGSRNGV